MTHPKPEEWAQYVCGEASPGERQGLANHLRNCADCRAEVDAWRLSLKRLDEWKLPSYRPKRELFAPMLRWAAAATCVLVLGIVAGRLSARQPDFEKFRAQLESNMRAELRQELAQVFTEEAQRVRAQTLAAATEQAKTSSLEYAAVLEARQVEQSRTFQAALDKLESQRVADLLSLKTQIDTVALNTDASFRQASDQLVQLAALRVSSPSSLEK